MRTRAKRILVLLAAGIAGCAFVLARPQSGPVAHLASPSLAEPHPDPRIDALLARYAGADPAAEARRAWAAGDRRWKAIAGVGIMVPGLDGADHPPRDQIDVMPCTSDCISGQTHAHWQGIAGRYALEYNRASRLLRQQIEAYRSATSASSRSLPGG